ncbi:hypothetical protein ABFS83_06G154000 [Erythranthe nasuta]
MKSNNLICFMIPALFCMFLIVSTSIDASSASDNGLKESETTTGNYAAARRVLQGSAPPNCAGKCGGCPTCGRALKEVEPGVYVWVCACQ